VTALTLADRQFSLLGAGYGDASTVAELRTGQLSKHLLLLRAIDRVASQRAPAVYAAARFADAYALLADVQRESPQAVQDILSYPHVGGWLCRCLERLHAADPVGSAVQADLAHLTGVACAAAIRAGVKFEITIPVRAGQIALPALGVATVPGQEAVIRGDRAGADVMSGGRSLRIGSDAAPADGWTPVRRISAAADGCLLSVSLDDLDPYRCHNTPGITPRVPEEEFAAWQVLVEQAWELLVRDHRDRAEALAAGLRSLVPQRSPDPHRSMSSTSTDEFGAVALSRPADPVSLAVTLVHEFQHGKLSAVMDLVPLHTGSSRSHYYAPWRDDPRPLGGLLQGTYAFLGVTDFWRVQRCRAAGEQSRAFAAFEFARWREQTSWACAELAASPDLTPSGRRFVSGMTATLRGWRNEEVPPGLAAQANESATEHRARWRICNFRPDAAAVREAARAWRAAGPAPRGHPAPDVAIGGPPSHADTARLRLRHLQVTDPARFARICDRPDEVAEAVPGATAVDVSYARGDLAAAAAGYRAQIRQSATAAGWVGLALACRGAGHGESATALLTEPEFLVAVYEELREHGIRAEPEVFARWMTTVIADQEDVRT
jgi:HEXXH motif-containing protein